MGELQIHVTSCFLMFIILLTAVVRPFDHGEMGKVLQALELASLVATWLTLWAGAVFISYPKCKVLYGSARNGKDSAYDQLTKDTQVRGRNSCIFLYKPVRSFREFHEGVASFAFDFSTPK